MRWRPLRVLLVAMVLPGVGQVLNRMPRRGLVFVFYILLLGTITYQLTTPEHSFLGRYAGGLFVYAISIMDAYTWAARTDARAIQSDETLDRGKKQGTSLAPTLATRRGSPISRPGTGLAR